MKKCYIAGQIGGLSELEYKTEFAIAKAEVADLGFLPVSPLDLPHHHDHTWQSYMREDITAMLQCDSVYALRNWRFSPCARIELETALNVGMNIIQQGK